MTSRRNGLFVLTFVVLVLVFLGAVPLAEGLENRPLVFASFWSICFLLVAAVLVLATYDLVRVRREHGLRMRELDKEFAAAAEEARDLARIQAEDGEDGGKTTR